MNSQVLVYVLKSRVLHTIIPTYVRLATINVLSCETKANAHVIVVLNAAV